MEEENVIKEEKKLVFAKKEVWISGVIGLLLGAIIMFLLYIAGVPKFGNETIATVKGGSVKKNDLYNEMKKAYSVNYALDVVDSAILKNKYKLTSDQEKEIQDQADYYISTYQTYYGYEEEEFLKEDGKYYVVIRAVHGKQQYDKECFYRFGEELILAKHPVLLEYLDQEYVKYSKIKESLTDDSKEHIRRRKEEVEDLLGDIMEALCYYEL